jgi:hypothetical protein
VAVQDLTPELRTRLNRVERAVGWFVILATLLLIGGFAYYFYTTAQRKGWFLARVPYHTYLRDATGLRVGDSVRMMGFEVGRITEITATPPEYFFMENNYDVFVKFEIREPFYGYIWDDSRTRVAMGDLLGNRVLEVIKGSTGIMPTVIEVDGEPARILDKDYQLIRLHTEEIPEPNYVLLADQPNGYWLDSLESPALTDRFDHIASRVEEALPALLNLTNQLAVLLTNTVSITARTDEILSRAEPVMGNVALISERLAAPGASLGEWLLPEQVHFQLSETLGSAQSTLNTAETNISVVAYGLHETLANLSMITSNLNLQVQSNDRILSQISEAVVRADEFMQGLQGHWFLRRAFRDTGPEEPPRTNGVPRNPMLDRRRF